MKEIAAQLQEGNEQKQLNWIEQMIDQLGDGYVQAQEHRQCQAQDCRRTQNGIDPDQQSQGNTPSKPSWRRPASQQGQNWKSYTAIEETLIPA